MRNIQKYEKVLRDRLALLSDRLEEIEEELDEPSSADVEERATEREGDEVLEQLGNAGLAEISQIRSALRKIEEGTYGICIRCGNPIPEKRLDAVPHTTLCIECAE